MFAFGSKACAIVILVVWSLMWLFPLSKYLMGFFYRENGKTTVAPKSLDNLTLEKATKFEKNLRRTFDKRVVFCVSNSVLVKKSTKIFKSKCGQVVLYKL